MTRDALPAGFVRVGSGRREAVARAEHAADAEALLADGMPYQSAARDLGARPLSGRGTAYAISLPVSRTRAVVRHNRHGGLLASLRGDLFVGRTRAPHELRVALRLIEAGVRTPPVLMYAVERVAPALHRADVVTREIVDSHDLAAYMLADADPRARADAWAAARELVRSLGDAGARHYDLNVKNVLLARDPGVPPGGALHAWVLDVDRVELGRPGDPGIATGNVARLLRSARKWRDERGGVFDERELRDLTPTTPPIVAHGSV